MMQPSYMLVLMAPFLSLSLASAVLRGSAHTPHWEDVSGAIDTEPSLQARATPYFLSAIENRGSYPEAWGGSSSYYIFRNVRDYGAVGDGATDDTVAIRNAITDGGRESGAKPAIVFVPAGNYLVSSVIDIYSNTQLIGDAFGTPNGPNLISTPDFTGEAVLSTAGPLFLGQIRNFHINMKQTKPGLALSAIRWRGGKGSNLYNVDITANKASTTQRGVSFDNASGGIFASMTLRDADVGFYGANDNFYSGASSIIGSKTAVHLTSGFGSVWTNLHIVDSLVAFRLLDESGASTPTCLTFMDTLLQNVKTTGILIAPPAEDAASNTPSITLENLGYRLVGQVVTDTTGSAIHPKPESWATERHWVMGPTYKSQERSWANGTRIEYPRDGSLANGAGFAGAPMRAYVVPGYPGYEWQEAGDFIHVKDYGAQGDGVSDDTKSLQAALDAVADGSKVLFVDAGVYLVSDTILVPKNARVVGEAWATIAGFGDHFSHPDFPQAVLRVGNANDVGETLLTSLTITTQGGTAGAILVEWNVGGGKARLLDVRIHIGGTVGSRQTAAECPASLAGDDRSRCRVAALLLHVTPSGSGTFESVSLSVAEIDTEGNQIALYAARGLLVESRESVWLYSVSSENAVMYQYNIHRARNVVAVAIQAKAPAFQPNPAAPAPFDLQVGAFPGDPDYFCLGDLSDGCDSAWAGIIRESQQVLITGVTSGSSYGSKDEACVDGMSCQTALWWVADNYDNVRLQQLATVGGKYQIVTTKQGVLAADNLATGKSPRWSRIAHYDAPSRGQQPA